MLETSQVVMRNHELFENFENGLVLGLPDDDLLSYIQPKHALTWNYAHFKSLKHFGDKVLFSIQPPEGEKYQRALIFLPKSKEEFKLLLAMTVSYLDPEAEIYLLGSKQEGIASSAKILLNYGENIFKIDSARHCQLWETRLKAGDYSFNLDDWLQSYSVEVSDIQFNVCTLPGVFSFGRLDEGTALLLESIDRVPSGRILDFGTGSGVIGTFLKLKNPDCQVEMVDIHALALFCSMRTLAENNIDAKIYPSDGWDDISKKFHAVFTNPPFHSGVKTHYETTESFLAKLSGFLVSGGRLWLVANQFLKYEAIIEKSLGRCDTFKQTTKFKIYRAFKKE
jgi:16S rRNA (guanine1207-N2)-methyltransferase